MLKVQYSKENGELGKQSWGNMEGKRGKSEGKGKIWDNGGESMGRRWEVKEF